MSRGEKPNISIVSCGNVDSGKSTSTGHMIYLCGGINPRIIEKYRDEAKNVGKQTFEYAWVLDKQKEERERGLTIDIALWKFETQHRIISIIDAPGHRDFIKNMISGSSHADAAVLFIDSVSGAFEAGLSGGTTKDHATLIYMLGIRQIIVCINKMDMVNYREERYQEIKDVIGDMLKKIGFKIGESSWIVPFIPISGYIGENLIKKSEKMPWYSGPTFLEILDSLIPPLRPINKPLRIPIENIYKIQGIGTVPVGRIETGTMRIGTPIIFAPGGARGVVKSIEMHHEELEVGTPGDCIGFCVKGVGYDQIKRGYVAGDENNDPPCETEEFQAQVIILNHPNEIHLGYEPVIDCQTSHIPCKIIKIIAKLDRRTGEIKQESPESIKTGDAAIVIMKPQKPVCLEKFSEYPPLGRFAIRDSKLTIGVGIIMNVKKKELIKKKLF